MRKLLPLIMAILLATCSFSQLSISPSSGCAGSSFNITITNTQSMSSSSPTCSAQGGITPAGGGSVTLSATNFPNLPLGTTSTTATLSIPQNFTPGSYGFSISTCAGTFTCNNCFTVLGKPTNVNISPSGTSQICAGATNNITCNATGATSYQWKRNGNNINLATSSTFNANTAGTYTCEAINTCGNTLSSNSLVVSVISAPTAVTVSAAGNTTFCSGGSVSLNCSATGATSYQWKLDNGDIINATTSGYSATASGTYTCSAINTCGGTISSNSVVVTVETTPNAATLSPNGNVALCQGQSQLFTCNAAGATSYQWYNSAGQIGSATSSTYTATAADSYYCIASGASCIVHSDTAQVTISANAQTPTLTSSAGDSVCPGETTTITASSGYTAYAWAGGEITQSITAPGGSYSVTVTATCGTATNSISIGTYSVTTPIINQNGNTLSTAAGTGSYRWFLNNVFLGGAVNNTYSPVSNGSYTVEVTDANGCVAVSAPFNYSTTGIENLSAPIHMNLMPNPAREFVTISASFTRPFTITLVNIYGQIVFTGTSETASYVLGLTKLSSGIYTLRLENEEGQVAKRLNIQ